MAACLEFLDLPQRSKKPRQVGLTFIRDPGLGVRQTQEVLETYGQFIDWAKIKQFEVFYMPEELTRAKVALYKKHDVVPFVGGTVIEAAIVKKMVPRTFAALWAAGFTGIELSDNLLDITIGQKIDLIGQAKKTGFQVIFEYGKKFDQEPIDVTVAAREIRELTEAGASRVVIERSQLDSTLGADCNLPTAGRIKDLVDRVGAAPLILEAETTKHLMWLLHELGPDINLGPNISPDYVVSALEPARCGLGRAEGFSLFNKLLPG